MTTTTAALVAPSTIIAGVPMMDQTEARAYLLSEDERATDAQRRAAAEAMGRVVAP